MAFVMSPDRCRLQPMAWIRQSLKARSAWVLGMGLCACGGGDEPVQLADAMVDAAPMIDAASAGDAGIPGPDAAASNDASATRDAVTPEASVPGDAAVADAAADAGDAAPLDPSVPSALLSQTGLYSDAAQQTLAAGVQAYEVRLELWADGATKKRFLYLPPGSKIDTTDPDAWIFPVGTKVWKEFTRDGVRVETRLIEKAANGADGWKHVAYAWNAAQTVASAVPLGTLGALGTAHDVPSQNDCLGCHNGSPDFVLGVSAFGLPVDGAGLSLAALVRDGRLTKAITAAQVAIPGNAMAQAALGTLHANCGSCHRPGTFAWEKSELELRLKVGTASLQQTPTYLTAVNVKVGQIFENVPNRITPGKPAQSAVYTRMISRAPLVGMPSVGTKIVDTAGSRMVADWIMSLTP